MSVFYRPLADLKIVDPKKVDNQPGPNDAKSSFDSMLNAHLNTARGKTSYKNIAQADFKPDNKETNSIDGLESLKDIDPEYYKKGLKKKTLAESFSSSTDAALNVRIEKYAHLVEAKAKKYNLDPNLLAGLIRQESNFNPYAVSHCGAMGLGQLMPETARYLGVTDPFNASQNLDGAAKYLKEQLDTFGGNVDKALAAYNAGPGAVKKFGGIPPYQETQNYVRAIRSHKSQISQLDIFKNTNKA